MVDGAKIKSLREEKGLSGAELGEIVGVGQAMVSHIERNFKRPTAELLKRIADCFEVKVDELYR